jgi:nucleoid DNA-binding protein
LYGFRPEKGRSHPRVCFLAWKWVPKSAKGEKIPDFPGNFIDDRARTSYSSPLIAGEFCLFVLNEGPTMVGNNKAPKSRTKSEMLQDLATKTGLNRKQVAAVFDELAKIINDDLGKKGPGVFTLPGLLKLKVIRKPAVKGGKEVPNPFKPGEMMITKSKPARNVVKALPLKSLKDMVQ